VAGLARWLVGGDPDAFSAMVTALLDMARLSVEVMLLLFGTLTLWLGLLRIGERAGLIELLAKLLSPLAGLVLRRCHRCRHLPAT